MAVTLPAAPATGQMITVNSVKYIWNGTAWVTAAPNVAAVVTSTVGQLGSRPATGNRGDFYIVSGDPISANDGRSFVWNGDTSQWVELAATDFADLDTRYLPVAGGTMTGKMMLPGKTTSNPEAVTRMEVDNYLLEPGKPCVVGGSVIETATYREHVFTSGAQFYVRGVLRDVEILLVGGGGGGGDWAGAGGGGGGVIYSSGRFLSGVYTCSIGVGGIAYGPGTGASGASGNGSNLNSYDGSLSLTAVGGGGGGGGYASFAGAGGGSGGGGGRTAGAGGAGTTGQGFAGGAGGNGGGGGGGGAGAAGAAASSTRAGNGGIGVTYLDRRVGGGGGGGAWEPASGSYNGGTTDATYGGAAGGWRNNAGAGANGKGGGGGGAAHSGSVSRSAGAGGSGVLVIRYPI